MHTDFNFLSCLVMLLSEVSNKISILLLFTTKAYDVDQIC